jgi:hypothetical protein
MRPSPQLVVLFVLVLQVVACSSETDDPKTAFRLCADLAQAGDPGELMARMTEKSLGNWTHNPQRQLDNAKRRFPHPIHTLETRKQDATTAKLHWTGLIGDTEGEVSGYYDMVFEEDSWKCTGIGSWYRQTK